jgi:hypothetical protein
MVDAQQATRGHRTGGGEQGKAQQQERWRTHGVLPDQASRLVRALPRYAGQLSFCLRMRRFARVPAAPGDGKAMERQAA